MSVVLPAPFGPSKPIARPLSTPSSDLRIGRLPNVTLSCSSSMTLVMLVSFYQLPRPLGRGSGSKIIGFSRTSFGLKPDLLDHDHGLKAVAIDGIRRLDGHYHVPEIITQHAKTDRRSKSPVGLWANLLEFYSFLLVYVLISQCVH